jgi:hypothetical protein
VKLNRPDHAVLIVLGVVIAGIIACAIARVDVPSILSELGILLAGIAGGAAIPSSGAAAAVPEPFLPPAPVPAPAPRPAPASYATDPAQTGVIPRVASHL